MSGACPPMVLFDVDGTLLITKGATSRCIRRACEAVLGPRFRWSKVTPGRLDPQIFTQLATRSGFSDALRHHDRYRERYLRELREELAARHGDVTVMPGVRSLLTELKAHQKRGELLLGLLTGNYGEAVRIKLDAAGLAAEDFRVTAFAEDGQERSDLLRHAMRQYERRTGVSPDPRRVVVVGDTPRDVACAHAYGCVAFAVATGFYSVEQLTEAGADRVVQDLSDPGALLETIAP